MSDMVRCKQCGRPFERGRGYSEKIIQTTDDQSIYCSAGCYRAAKQQEEQSQLESARKMGNKLLRKCCKNYEKLGKYIEALKTALRDGDHDTICKLWWKKKLPRFLKLLFIVIPALLFWFFIVVYYSGNWSEIERLFK